MVGWVLVKERKFISREGHPKINPALAEVQGQEGTGMLGEGRSLAS